ncbi:aspartate aminotransferase [Enterococcus sulfureus ATCC 49903]|uniref:Aminotransferase n=1 Tax=Enterococcus sulfureus ATCC 49903 TaxID=1140003 RepID=S0P6J1_9ENTE|nr:pyridoxal phosphate-dependent aminotransferase [Enterococcus sulfureus]EOT48043.1 aspartate aminotransferase [Enterococcus sulfureus ATCC 49903]EOT84101.1 aspartate aminotransferase [Enterococcus sulfureus ATCC 49903]
MNLSTRAQNIEPSATLKASTKAKQLQAQGKDILSLTVGEPDFATPETIQNAAIEVIKNGKASYYTATAGIPELRQAIVEYLEKFYHVTYTPSQTIVTDGAKYALYLVFQAILDEGDEVIIPTPYWVSYSEQIKLAQGRSVFVETTSAQNFQVMVEQLEAARTPRTKAILLNSPSNPTGMIYSKLQLKEIGEWAVAHDILIIADDIYGRLVYGEETFTPIVSLSEKIKEQTIIINGVSKTYAMTGWRIGFAVGNQTIINAMIDIASQATSNPTAVSQYAAVEALVGDQTKVEEMRQAFEIRRNTMFEALQEIPGFDVLLPAGAFYFFPNVQQTLELCGYTDVDDFVDDLLYEANVAVVTGKAFGAAQHIRLSYAADQQTLDEAVARIKKFVEKKQKK